MTDSPVGWKTLPNGLTVIVEEMPEVRSAAFCWLLPAGVVYEEAGKNGTAALLAELMFRGAGDYSDRELLARLDSLGIQNDESITPSHLVYSGSCLAVNLPAALDLYAEILLRPHLEADELDPARAKLEQMLLSVEDEPKQKVMQELRRRCFPQPWGRPTEGELADLDHIEMADLLKLFKSRVEPSGTILAVAGRVTLTEVVTVVSERFGDWEPHPAPAITAAKSGPAVDHLLHESTQTQIGIAYPTLPYGHDDYYQGWAAVNILSGGMSSRLFTEVREKRGLCYSVYAGVRSLKGQAQVLCYTGSQNDRAQQALDVMLVELKRLSAGITADELRRCQALAKSELIMSEESSSARAGSLARDWYFLGRVQPLDEVRRRIESITVTGLNEFLARHPAEQFTILTIGPKPLEVTL